MCVCDSYVAVVDAAHGTRGMVVVELVRYFGGVVLDERSSEADDIGTEDGRVRYGAGVAGRGNGGEVLHLGAGDNERQKSAEESNIGYTARLSNKKTKDYNGFWRKPLGAFPGIAREVACWPLLVVV
jgi:hypothetical protein